MKLLGDTAKSWHVEIMRPKVLIVEITKTTLCRGDHKSRERICFV